MIPVVFDSPAPVRIGWALVHLIWQGTLIALALRAALTLIPQHYSRLRYALALTCLVLMAAMPVFLLCKPESRSLDNPATYESVQFETSAVTDSSFTSVALPGKPEVGADVRNLLTPLVPWIALCWLLGTTFLLLKTVGGILQVHILKRKAAVRCESVRAAIADIPILESESVSVPTVAGWFKPVVLLPKGVLRKFNQPMLDALVAHELAHIRRHDSVMALLQALIEDLLFFHPAMWWVTKNVSAEREACCDDAAVSACGNTLVYVRALSQAEQFRSSLPVIALSSSPLLHRIRRLTEMRVAKPNNAANFCLVLLAVAFIIGMTTGSVLLATIPSEAASSSGADQNSEIAQPQAQTGRYALLCGIVGVKVDKETGKRVFSPPLEKDGRFKGMCILLDASQPVATRVDGELKASELINKVEPVYPEPAIREHVGIRVTLKIRVDEEGQVTDAAVMKSQTVPPDQDSEGKWVGGANPGVIRSTNSAAVDAVKQWRYSPTLLDGKAIPVMITTWITFTFNKDGSPKIILPNF